LAVTESDKLNGVIIESGRPNLGRFADGLEPAAIQALEDDYHAKFYSIDIPALVIHGEWDELAPLSDAVDMHDNFKTTEKRLEIIPSAGHNDLMYVGYQQYFSAIRGFITRYARRDAAAPTTGETTD
jgi:pimeloyl-ACP methyl ester carboxylesterase